MAWVEADRTTLYSGGVNVGSVALEYDSSSTGSERSCRVIVIERSGYYFSVNFDNFTVDGDYIGYSLAVTQNSGVIWTGGLAPGSRSVTWSCPWYSGTANYSLTGSIPASGSAPSGADVAFVSSTWNSVTMTSSVASWGAGYSGTPDLEGIFVDPTATSSNWTSKGRVVKRTATSALSYTFQNVSNTNFDATYDGGYTLKGMTPYKIAVWAHTSAGTSSKLDDTTRCTPPAPGQFTYTETSTGVFAVEYTGVAANNYSGYTASELTRTVRYREQGTSTWTDVTSGVAALTDVTQATITVPAGKTYEVEAWMTYRGNQSEVSSITITNSTNPVALYASARGVSKKVAKLYGPVNGQTKKIKKLYGSVGGVTKLIFEDNS